MRVTVITTLGFRWYCYVAFADSPYDKVAIGLNGKMPRPLRNRGCHKLQTCFTVSFRPTVALPRTVAPGCKPTQPGPLEHSRPFLKRGVNR
jgi:hypothetical protein